MRWRDARRQGREALQVRYSPGRPLKLAATQRKKLIRLLLKEPLAQGYRTNLWTTARIAKVIESQFGVIYHPDYIREGLYAFARTIVPPTRPDHSPVRQFIDAKGKMIKQFLDKHPRLRIEYFPSYAS
jgi:transposase